MFATKIDTAAAPDRYGGSPHAERKFNHYIEPTVTDRPEVVDAIQCALDAKDDAALAELVCLHGLPPAIRPRAWPALLRMHPYVLEAVNGETDSSGAGLSESDCPHNRIRNDILRWCRTRGDPDALYSAIVSFLRKYGRKIKYETPMIWIADFLLNGDQKSYPSSPRRSPLSSPTGSPRSASSFSSAATPCISPLGSPVRTIVRPSSFLPSQPTRVFSGVDFDDFQEVFCNVMLIFNHCPVDFYRFISLMRTLMPELEQHFAYEGVLGSSGGDVWLVWWLKWYGIRAMPPQLLCRLWDQYFAVRRVPPHVSEVHAFNCLVVVRENVTKLLELDQSEIRQFLSHVPKSIDIEAVVSEARTLRIDYAQRDDP